MSHQSIWKFLLAIVVVTVAFQNCGQPGELELADPVNYSPSQDSLSTPRDPVTLISNHSILINNGDDYTKSTNVTLHLTAVGAEEMLISDSLDCQGGTWEPFSATRTWTLSDANRENMVYAMFRKKGVPETDCVSDSIVHDNIPPTVSVTKKAPSYTNKSSEVIEFVGVDSGSGIESIKCLNQGGTEVNCPGTYTFSGLSQEGSHSVTIIAIDKAGNLSSPVTEALIVDKTAPIVKINGPSGIVAQTDADITISVIESGLLQSITCRLAPIENQFKDCSSLNIKYQGLGTNNYTFEAKAVDAAGNEGVASIKWEVDLTVPTVKITKAPAAITNIKNAKFEFTGSSGTKPINVFKCRLDGGALENCTSPHEYVNLSDKEYTFTLIGTNEVGTSSAPQTYKWIVDTVLPTISIVSGPNGNSKSPTATFVLNASDANGIKTVECSLNGGAYADCSSKQVTYENLADGEYTFRARATDNAGNVAYSEERKWKVDTTPDSQIIANITPNPVKENTQATLQIQVVQVSNVSYNCKTLVTNKEIAKGNVTGSSQNVNFMVNEDLRCEVIGKDKNDMEIKKVVEAQVGCGNRVKKDGRCVDFICQNIITLPLTDNLTIPARTGDGICYVVKLFNAVANSKSNLTTVFDNEIVSRNHDSTGGSTRNPYVLGKALVNFKLQGPRIAKLAGSTNPNASILVDNFVLVGLYPKVVTPTPAFYTAHGTKDATVDQAETHIKFKNQPVPLIPFASGGTATVSPLEIVSEADTHLDYILDIRALDCGGVRELSNVYLLFQ